MYARMLVVYFFEASDRFYFYLYIIGYKEAAMIVSEDTYVKSWFIFSRKESELTGRNEYILERIPVKLDIIN